MLKNLKTLYQLPITHANTHILTHKDTDTHNHTHTQPTHTILQHSTYIIIMKTDPHKTHKLTIHLSYPRPHLLISHFPIQDWTTTQPSPPGVAGQGIILKHALFFFLVVLEKVEASLSSGTPRVYQGDCGATKATHDTPGVNEFLPTTGGTSPPGHSPTHVDRAVLSLFGRRARLGREGSDDHSYSH